jgi:hypothetical protein
VVTAEAVSDMERGDVGMLLRGAGDRMVVFLLI